MNADPFGTAGLRDAVLGAWRASPARFREDANTEEDHARGYYRDRVLVDLAQNGADAAVQAGQPGRLLIRLEPDGAAARLVVANTGAPLDAAGVAALASMRTSAKRDAAGLVGRFGVGFAAVRAVADEIEVRSTTGTVRFSLAAVRDMLADATGPLADEVARRDDRLPVLRLPLAGPVDPRPGYTRLRREANELARSTEPIEGVDERSEDYDTAVVAWLRDDAAVAAVRAQLDDVGDPLLLGLPGLAEIVVETPEGSRRVADVADRWQVRTVTGTLDPQALADRPVEERDRPGWQVTWALPRDLSDDWRRVVHAPTPTDDPCTLPALLVATLPLDPTRRRVQVGSAAAEAIVTAAADAYAALAADVAAAGGDASALVPVGLPAGELDARLHEAVVEALRRVPVLRGPAGLLVPAQAVALAAPAGHDRTLVAALARRVPALVGLPPGGTAALRVLGVPVRSLAEVVEALPLGPGPWTDLYDAVAALLPDQAEALASLPVPLADGRVVRGVRGTVVLDPALADRLSADMVATLGEWGVRLVDPASVCPVLMRLGAVALDAQGLLASPQVRGAILDLQDDQGADGLGVVAQVVAELVRLDRDDRGPGSGAPRPVLGLVELPAADGEPVPAQGLVLPGSPAHRLFDERVLPPVSRTVVDLLGEPVLRALGVRAGPVAVRVGDVVAEPAGLDPDGTDDDALVAAALDGWPDYVAWLSDRLGPGAWLGDLVAVADLDAVADDAWPALVAALAADRDLRAALVTPVRTPQGTAPSYTAWWLTHRGGLGLGAPFALRPDVLPGWLPAPPSALADTDDEVLRAVGGVGAATELDLPGWAQVLDGAMAGESVAPTKAVALWQALAALVQGHADGRSAAPGGDEDQVPQVLPALVGPDRAALVRAESVVVADAPMWCQRTDLGAVLPAPTATAAALADLLDLPLATELAAGQVDGPGTPEPVPGEVVELLGADSPASWHVHDELTVDGVEVEWWVDADGTVHAVHLAGLAAALAQTTGRWSDRWAFEAVLADPARAPETLLDRVFAT